MDICINKYTFKHGKNMLMTKEKYDSSGSRRSACDIDGTLIFSYTYLENHIVFREMDIIIDGAIVSADYEEEKEMLVVLKVTDKVNVLLIYDHTGDCIKEIAPPSSYEFVSLKNNGGNIMVVARGMSDATRDEFGRNDWNFVIDFENLYVERKSITQ